MTFLLALLVAALVFVVYFFIGALARVWFKNRNIGVCEWDDAGAITLSLFWPVCWPIVLIYRGVAHSFADVEERKYWDKKMGRAKE